jgi:hypothetical protein
MQGTVKNEWSVLVFSKLLILTFEKTFGSREGREVRDGAKMRIRRR